MVKARLWAPRVGWAVLTLALPLGVMLAQDADDEQGVRLSLDETLSAALARNLDLVSARLDPRISEQNVQSRQAGYDVDLTADVLTSTNETEVFGDLENVFSTREFVSGGIGIRQQLPFGANYSIRLDGNRFEQSGLRIDPAIDPDGLFFRFFSGLDRISYTTGLSLDLTVPLAQGLGKETETEPLILARSDLAMSRERLRIDAHRVMEEVEGAYWDVVADREGRRIARLSLQRADELLALNRKKVEAGTLPPIEITEAEAGVAAQVERVILAETALENAEDQLLLLLATPESSPMWELPIIPTDTPSFVPVEIDLAETIALALERRPEIINARRTLADREMSERVARRRTRPNIDLSARVRPVGDDFDLTKFEVDVGSDGIFGTDDDFEKLRQLKLGDALREIPAFDNYDWSLGLDIAYPIRNRAAKADYATARLDREKAQIDLRNEEQSIRVGVRRAVRAVESGAKRVEAARLSVELQRKKLDAERRKFANGMSTSFEVLSFQRDLADAELAETRAELDYVKALTALERAKGTLLEARGLTLAE